MIRRIGILALLALLSFGCGKRTAIDQQSPADAGVPVYPAAGWEKIARPESAGWSSAGLEQVRRKLTTMKTTGMMAVVGGRVLFEYGDLQRVSYLASVRKSVLSMLVGIYQERGMLDVNKTLEQLGMDDVQGLTPLERQARVIDLLTARSGVYHPASNPGDDTRFAPARGTQKPGTFMLYNNWDFNALGTAFETMTGVDIYDAVGKDIAQPIGMQDWDRSRQRKSGNASVSRHLAYHLKLSTRGMARIGYLMLREGDWNGIQIVPRAWVRESTRTFTPRTEMNPPERRAGEFGYGYLWWVFDNPHQPPEYKGAYAGLGAVGQPILVMPALDLVVAHKTDPADGGSVSHEQFLGIVRLLVAARLKR